eukprot:3305905-Rhodomonas_salina.3
MEWTGERKPPQRSSKATSPKKTKWCVCLAGIVPFLFLLTTTLATLQYPFILVVLSVRPTRSSHLVLLTLQCDATADSVAYPAFLPSRSSRGCWVMKLQSPRTYCSSTTRRARRSRGSDETALTHCCCGTRHDL